MPDCIDCLFRTDQKCLAHERALSALARPISAPPIGACFIPIIENYKKWIQSGHRVLEIGVGSWSPIREHCVAVGAHYEGIDTEPEYYGKKCLATRLENLADLSFEDDAFDVVIGSQTMEHWGEFGCDLRWGIYQIFRVLRPRGMSLFNVPIHFHGTREFLLGDYKKISELYSHFADDLIIEKWGKNTEPLAPFIPYPRYSALRNSSAYIVDLRASKSKPLPPASQFRNRTLLPIRLKRWMNYPISFNLYRLKEKMRRHGIA